jgi:hypothetical protein
VLQNDFEPRSEQNFFQIKAEQGILIQKFTPSDSNITRFWRSDEVPPTLQHNRPLSTDIAAQANVGSWGVHSTGQCNTACSLSAGVWKPKVFRGR